jgi:uncharacterized protein DUF1570
MGPIDLVCNFPARGYPGGMLAFVLSLFILLPGGGDDPPLDKVQLTKGKPIQGVILRNDASGVWLAQKSRIKHFPRADVVSMEGPRVSYPVYLDKMRAEFNQSADADRCVIMAKWCEQKGLIRDANLYYWRALLDNPSHQAANEALGHRKSKGRYRIKVKGKGKMSFTELQEYHQAEFKDGWELTTTHFNVKGSGSLADMLGACADLELLYQAYFNAFQEVVGFWELREPLTIYLYPSRGDMPPLSSTTGGYFDFSSRTVYAYFKDGVAQNLIHEASHAVLYGSIREFARNDPAIPGWLYEGLANYMEKGFAGNPGDRTFMPKRAHPEYFETHSKADKPDGIQRVLNYRPSDFLASTNQALKYSESYTLFFYLLNSGDDEILDGCYRFLASVYERKGSSSHFKNAMEIRDWDTFEEDWLHYAEKIVADSKAEADK